MWQPGLLLFVPAIPRPRDSAASPSCSGAASCSAAALLYCESTRHTADTSMDLSFVFRVTRKLTRLPLPRERVASRLFFFRAGARRDDSGLLPFTRVPRRKRPRRRARSAAENRVGIYRELTPINKHRRERLPLSRRTPSSDESELMRKRGNSTIRS